MRTDLLARVDGLRSRRTPFVLATVVRAERPTSAKPGDCAVVTADGTVDGFVGGVCAESTVRVESLRLLAVGERVAPSQLLRITPDAGAVPEQAGVRTVGNPCLSGGTLDIFLEAVLPPVLVAVFGESPVASAVVRVGAAMEWDVRVGPSPPTADTAAVVVAAHGRGELPVLRAALDAGVDHIALVASRRRAAAVLDELAATPEERARIQAPAGLPIGARSAVEVALSICAGIVAARPRPARPASASAAPPAPGADASPPGTVAVAVDPMCGMEVAVSPASRHDGEVYFCGPGCQSAWRARGTAGR